MSTTVSSIPKVRLLRSVFTLVQNLRYKEIHKHRHFKSAIEKSAYIDLLNKEMCQINTMNLDTRARKLYKMQQNLPTHPISKRCLDFCNLEIYAKNYIQQIMIGELA